MSIPPNKKTEHALVSASKNQHGPERENQNAIDEKHAQVETYMEVEEVPETP